MVGRTPADLDLPAGAQTLTLTVEGYDPEDLALDVRAGIPVGRTVVLHPKASALPAAAPYATRQEASREERRMRVPNHLRRLRRPSLRPARQSRRSAS